METVESLPVRFSESGLRISTGPVVMFRAREFLLQEVDGDDTIPLLLPHNVKRFETVWPVKKNNKPIAFRVCERSLSLVLATKNYVLLKRFSAKEERRRLVASCFFGSRQAKSFVALENHLNYIYRDRRELSEDETYGVAALLNSTLFDRYFRIISGNTQVNATELRSMKFPRLSTVARIGKRVMRLFPLSADEIEDVVLEELKVPASVEAAIMESLA